MSESHQQETLIEKVLGNPLSESAITFFAASIGSPVAALLPLLTNSLVCQRHKDRVDKALAEVNSKLLSLEANLNNLTESQYQLVNESVLAMMQTPDLDKIEFLKKAICNSIERDLIPSIDVVHTARILRDISVQELEFLKENSKYKSLAFGITNPAMEQLVISHETQEASIVSGLIALGVVMPSTSTLDDMGVYCFSPITDKLIALVE